ncbi:glycosyltransferase [Acaryochloris marina NIES-2412]|uniref:glycosyltransferase n=1 Tax=Acaryochloris marina TaxID=155978 RepID=UPI004058B082
MKIAFLVGDFPSISETFILNQITHIIDEKHSIDIYASRPQNVTTVHPDVEKYQLLDCTQYYPSMPSNYLLRSLKGILLFLKGCLTDPVLIFRSLNIWRYGKQALSFRLLYAVVPFLKNRPTYDVVHCHFGHLGILGSQLRDIGAVQGKLCTTFHAWDITEYLQEAGDDAYRQLFIKGDQFLPISQYWQERLIELGCPAHKITVHHMGIDCQQFLWIARQLQEDESVQITTVARLVEKKGVEYGIRAIAQLKNCSYPLKYSIVGDGPLREYLEQLITELGLDSMIELLGWKSQDEVIDVLNQTHLLLAPSVTGQKGDQEGIPVALMEAMAMGLPVVSTHYSGIPELVEHDVSGFLLPERDSDAIAEKLIYLIDHSERWGKMGQAGRAHVQSHFNINQLTQQLISIYSQM